MTRWGSFGFFGPLTTHPDYWDRGVGSRLMEQVVETFSSWELRQAGLFTFPNSPKHLGLYQKFGFWPRFLTAVMAKPTAAGAGDYALFSHVPAGERPGVIEAIAELTDAVFSGLDVRREIEAVAAQGLGDTVLLYREAQLVGVAVCHCGAGSEAGERSLLREVRGRPARSVGRPSGSSSCSTPASPSRSKPASAASLPASTPAGSTHTAGMLARGFRSDLVGVAMHSRPDGPDFDSPGDYVIDDLR